MCFMRYLTGKAVALWAGAWRMVCFRAVCPRFTGLTKRSVKLENRHEVLFDLIEFKSGYVLRTVKRAVYDIRGVTIIIYNWCSVFLRRQPMLRGNVLP